MGAILESRRTRPRVWVETLWLLESLDEPTALREIPLRRGLNLILSEPMEGSPGHGVGKTAFCQLLRFVLEDSKWDTGTPLRDELCQAMPNGAVAARVHVDGETWTVLKPWQHQKRYRAAKEARWQQLASNEVTNEHDAYVQALEDKLVGILPVQKLPGSNQSIQWQHLLAWCSRDQGSRYQSYYHWRTEGAGFSLRAQSPALLVKIVLGLLKDASLHEERKKKESKLESLRSNITTLERRPTDLLAHVKHQLANALGVEESSPFHKASLFEESSLKGLAEQQIQKCVDDLQQLQQQHDNLEQERLVVLEQRAPLSSQKKAVENRIAQLQASIDGNDQEVERLKKEPAALQEKLATRCDAGNRLLRDCHYVCERIEVVELSSIRDSNERQKKNEAYKTELSQLRPVLQALAGELTPYEEKITGLARSLNEAKGRELEILGKKNRLEEAITDYKQYEAIIANPSDWQELTKLKSEEAELERDINRIDLSLRSEQSQYRDRKQVLASMVNEIAKFLPGFSWGVFDDSKPHPFHMGPMHSTTYGVLETLAGDLTCLLDSNNPESYHPGFLLHDSPREAEMSEALFWALILIAKKYDTASSCQFIVTTSTRAPTDFADFVRLRLHSREEDGFLFRKRIGMEEQPLEM